MLRRRPFHAQAVASALLLLPLGASAQLNTQLVASGLQFPVFVAAPVGDARLFIVQQGGIIKILKNGSVLPTPFLDIHTLTTPPAGNDERGLLGLCFAPDYATSGQFYVYYTNTSSNSVVRRYTVSANPDSADPASAHDVLFQTQPFSNHNGGTLAFGPDGYLYFGLGDGGSENDPQGNGQNTNTLLSKMLRIDPFGDDFPLDPINNYRIPPTNPFVGMPGFRAEIWAIGVRNPYRWSFDRLTGDLWIGDVGQNCWEEVDFQPAGSAGGQNYGWKITEGFHCFLQGGGCNPTGCSFTGLTLPIREYSHSQDGFSCSISGGSVYRGSAMPNLQGTYFYADFCSAQIYSLRYDGVNVTDLTNRTADLAPGGGLVIGAPVAIAEDGFGELYIVDRASTTGEVYKIIPDPAISGVQPTAPAAAAFALGAPSPNPFRARTQFDLRLDAGADVRVTVHDAAGRLVRSVFQGAGVPGARSLEWDGRDSAGRPVPAGVYFVRAVSAGRMATQRIVRVR
ncbi:MAG: PQQ-dependent sugar dehydrogenase [bacterium]